MPLRFVEAATRDDAIAAAREQFGPAARVVGVRRVRSGGVLGFFSTERYVAEVATEPARGPAVPVPTSRSADDVRDDDLRADFSSPLASATPARARAAAPPRNGAAVWAAEAARVSRDLPASSPASSPTSSRDFAPAMAGVAALAADGWPVAAPRTSAPARTGSQPATPRAAEERVSELAGLLTAPTAAPEPPAYTRERYSRAEFQRAGSPRAQDGGQRGEDLDGGTAGFGLPVASAAPSPFTAALARMVSGDRDVRQAVREALDDPAAPRARSNGDSWPTPPGALAPADIPVASSATRQEETVGDQVIAPSSSVDHPAGVPSWAAEPEVHAPSASPREEAIAEVLRAALAQGHSDEALAGILRKVLAGVPPQTALAEPETAAPEHAVPPVEAPVRVPAPVAEPVAVEGDPSSAPLWGKPVTVTYSRTRQRDEPIRAESTRPETGALTVEASPLPDEAAAEIDAAQIDAPEIDAAEIAAGGIAAAPLEAVPEAPALEALQEFLAGEDAETGTAPEPPAEADTAVESEVAALAPTMAREASDPAPLMSLDATTVMPPLSLLPPLPSSRGGGRPPVPPASRPLTPRASAAATPTPTTTATTTATAEPDSRGDDAGRPSPGPGPR